MIKLRIEGEPEEIEQVEEIICNCGEFRVLNISKNYKNRGASIYERVYIDVELIDRTSIKDGQSLLPQRSRK